MATPDLEHHIAAALTHLPVALPPGHIARPDFGYLEARIYSLRYQHIIMCLIHWVARNATWLGAQGFQFSERLSSNAQLEGGGLRRPRPQEVLEGTDYPAHQQQPAAELAIALLVGMAQFDSDYALEIIRDLNQINWKPRSVYRVLATHASELVPSPTTWIAAHRTHARMLIQTQMLQEATPPAQGAGRRGRL